MKKLLFPMLCTLLFPLGGSAQTKRIAHYSHAGRDLNFRADGADNFGIVYRHEGGTYVAPDTSVKSDRAKYLRLRQQAAGAQPLQQANPVTPVQHRETVQQQQPAGSVRPRPALSSAPAAQQSNEQRHQIQPLPAQQGDPQRPSKGLQQSPSSHRQQSAGYNSQRPVQ